MTEAQLTRRELKKIRDRWPSAFVWKINDRITAGVPDVLLVNGRARTHARQLWIEWKRPLSMNADSWALLTPLQQKNVQRLVHHDQQVVIGVFWPNKTITFDYVFRRINDGLNVDLLRSTHHDLVSLLTEEYGW